MRLVRKYVSRLPNFFNVLLDKTIHYIMESVFSLNLEFFSNGLLKFGKKIVFDLLASSRLS